MKALNRKSSTTSLPMNDGYAHESRASVPPDHMLTTTSSSPSERAKSVSKEPGSREGSAKPGSHSSLFAPSRFFSLSRRIAKIRFSSSSQPPPPVKSPLATEELDLSSASLKADQKSKSQLLVPDQADYLTDDDKTPKKSFRDRALSPSRIFRSLRPRSPFSKSNRNSKANTAQSAASPAPTTTISGKNKSFTVTINSPPTHESSPLIQKSPLKNHNLGLMSASYHSASISSSNNNIDEATPSISSNVSQSSFANRFVRATTAAPSSLLDRSHHLNQPLQSDKQKSLSCEFIDNVPSILSSLKPNSTLKQLSENDETNADNSSNVTNASYSTNPKAEKDKRLLSGGFSALGSVSKVETLRRNFMEQGGGQSHEIVKSVKFKEPEKASPSKSDMYKDDLNDGEDRVGTLGNFKKLNVVKFDDANGNSRANGSAHQRMKNSLSASNVDKPPKVPNALPTSNTSSLGAFSIRNKFYGGKSRTIDFPENGGGEQSPSSQLKSSNSVTSNINNNNLLTPSGRPIQSILRRSETPTKSSLRQPSIESHDSTRETSIEKLLKSSSSTSRPLMFNN
jgi:hypothetical protein